MNTKKKKKLVLGKTTVTNLVNVEMDSARGGFVATYGPICRYHSFAPLACPSNEVMCP